MTKYTNPEMPDVIEKKPSAFSQLHEGVRLGIFLVLGLGLIVLMFFYTGALVGRYIPFEWEETLARAEVFPLLEPHPAEAQAKEQALQALADRIAAEMELKPEITITIHYRNEQTVNAFAGFAGNIYIFEGLLSKLKYEEEVAALLAHEIGHVKNRHIMQSFSANVFLSIAFAVASGDSGAADSLGRVIMALEGLQFTRSMEKEADDEALKALEEVYGGVGGFVALFNTIDDGGEIKAKSYEFLLTHPYSDNRIARAEEFAEDQGAALDAPTRFWAVDANPEAS